MSNRSISFLSKRVFGLCLFSLCVFEFVTSNVCFAGPPVEIRFSAAVVSHRANYQHNQPFDYFVESAGYDVMWRGQIFNESFQHNGAMVLLGEGQTKNVYKIGGGSCTGTLRVNPDMNQFSPIITENRGGIVKMNIPLPHTVANTGLNAFLMDKNQPEQSACRTATAGLGTATCYNPTRDCYSIEGSISPQFPAPGDSTPLGKFTAHSNSAYFEFSDNNPSYSTPFFFTATDKLYDHEGKLTDLFKIVWVGYLSITTSVGNGTPGPFNPFAFFDYDPSSLGGPPNDPSPPTGNPHNPTDPGYDVREFNSWMKNLGDSVSSFLHGVQNFFGGSPATLAAVVPVNGKAGQIGTFDDETGIGVLPGEVLKTPPASGDIQVRIKTKSKNKAKGFKLKVTKSTIKNKIISGKTSPISFELDKSVRQVLKKGAATTAFVTAKFSPANGKKAVEKRFKFQLRKRR